MQDMHALGETKHCHTHFAHVATGDERCHRQPYASVQACRMTYLVREPQLHCWWPVWHYKVHACPVQPAQLAILQCFAVQQFAVQFAVQVQQVDRPQVC
jgi:hypothetical protein